MYRSVLHSSLMFALAGLMSGCSGSTENGPASNEGQTAGTGGSGSLGGGGGYGGSGAGDGTIDGGGAASAFKATPVRDLKNLESITFYERTGGSQPTHLTFDVDGPELTTHLADPLGSSNYDIDGAETEFYDVYYSDADGAFALDGAYLTISGVFLTQKPAGGGLNLAEISLNFSGEPPEYGNYVASFFAHGDNAVVDSVPRCIDGDLLTHTTMGNTIGTDQRLRLTLGFLSTSGPPPR